MSSSRPPSPWALAIGFTLIYISWGTTYLPTRLAVHDEHMPPALFGGIRLFAAGLLLLAYQVCRGAGIGLTRGDFGKILGVSFLLFVAGSGLMNAANETVPSGVCAVLAATTPLWLGLFGMLWPQGDRLTARGWLGLLIGLVGVLLLVIPKLTGTEEFVHNIGVVLVLGSAASWAIGSLVLRRLRFRTSHLTSAAYQMIFGGVSLSLVGVMLGECQRWPETMAPRVLAAFCYLLIFGSLVGFVAFNWLLGHVAAAKVGTYAYVNPVVAVLVGWVAGEEINVWLAAGICVILFGVFLVRGGERHTANPILSLTHAPTVQDRHATAGRT